MTAKELIDDFVQEKISADMLLFEAAEPASVFLDLMRQEIKEAEAEQTRLMELLVKIQRDTHCTISKGYVEAIKQIVNGN